MSDVRAQADLVAAQLVTEHLGGSVSHLIYERVVAVVALAYMRGSIAARDDVLGAWNEQLAKMEATL